MDRYTPGEAVATAKFKNKPNYDYIHSQKQPISFLQSNPYSFDFPSSSASSTQGLYAFPPNLNSNYPPDISSNKNNQNRTITSYLPPPSGISVDISNSENGFIGPVSPEYLPSHLKTSSINSDNFQMPQKISNMKNEMMNSQMEDEQSYPSDNNEEEYHSLPHDFNIENEMNESPPKKDDMTPMHIMPSISINGNNGKDNDKPNDNHDDIYDNHNIMDEHNHDHDQNLKQNPIESFKSNFFGDHGINVYPEIIIDHHPPIDHIYDDHHHLPSPTTTERPEQPRVKKYSYFYLGRKLWYIPLYFTVWFSFYILFLIIKSIARHKVSFIIEK